MTQRCASKAYKRAKITNPAKQIAFAEVFDCFAPFELLMYEALGFCS
jgi:hypothetical protein